MELAADDRARSQEHRRVGSKAYLIVVINQVIIFLGVESRPEIEIVLPFSGKEGLFFECAHEEIEGLLQIPVDFQNIGAGLSISKVSVPFSKSAAE